MDIKISVARLVHNGGTKFYEVAQFRCETTGRFVNVFRWGKIAFMKTGGGQTKIEVFTNSVAAEHAADKKFDEKRRGGYEVSYGGGPLPDRVPHDMLGIKLGDNYSDAAVIDSITANLGLNEFLTGITAAPGEENEICEIDDTPEPIRGEEWASW